MESELHQQAIPEANLEEIVQENQIVEQDKPVFSPMVEIEQQINQKQQQQETSPFIVKSIKRREELDSPKRVLKLSQRSILINNSNLKESVKKEQELEKERSMEKRSASRSSIKDYSLLYSDQRALFRSTHKNKENFNDLSDRKPNMFLSRPPGVISNYKIFELQKRETSPIVFKEFKLFTEDRGKSKQQSLKQKLEYEEVMAEKQKVFLSKPIANYRELANQGINCNIEHPKNTIPVQFNLQTNDRANLHRQTLTDSQQQNESYQFKSRKMPNLSQPKTPVKPPVRESTKPHSPKLNSTSRASKRKEFDSSVNEKMEQFKKLKELELQNNDENEGEGEREDFTCFKANPIRQYRALRIEKSEKKLTTGVAPQFQTDIRIKQKNEQTMHTPSKSNDIYLSDEVFTQSG